MNNSEISKVNEYLKEQLWMDFEMCKINRGTIELFGFLDEAYTERIKITFKQLYFVSCALFFTYEGKENFISITTGEEAFQINKKYGVTQGNVIFKISNTNIESDMFIIAKEIEFQKFKLN